MMQGWQHSWWVRRLVFLGVNLASGLIIATAIVMPIHDVLAGRDRLIAEQRTTLGRLRGIAAQETAVQTAARQFPADIGEYLAGKTEGVINADLQTRLKAMVEAAGARLRSVRILPPQTNDKVRYVGSRIEIYGPLPAIQRAVHVMETSKPYLFVKGAVIKPAPPAGKQDSPREPIIEAQPDIFGATRVAGSDR